MGLCRLTDYVCSFVPYQLGPFATPASCNLSDKLSDYGLKVAPAPPDGNCFFNAVAINIMADLTNWSECLTAAGIVNHNLTVQTLSGMLRQAFVTELLSERCSTYEAFTDNDLDITAEMQKFKQDHFFDNELGNTMPLALATALQCFIVIFSRDPIMPTMYITPEIIAKEVTAFLVYIHTRWWRSL